MHVAHMLIQPSDSTSGASHQCWKSVALTWTKFSSAKLSLLCGGMFIYLINQRALTYNPR